MPAPQVLADALPGLIAGLRFDKPMRWNSSNVFFSRPIRWLLALYSDRALTFEYAGVASGNTTCGLRTHQPQQILVQDSAAYFAALSAQGIILDVEQRREAIAKQMFGAGCRGRRAGRTQTLPCWRKSLIW